MSVYDELGRYYKGALFTSGEDDLDGWAVPTSAKNMLVYADTMLSIHTRALHWKKDFDEIWKYKFGENQGYHFAIQFAFTGEYDPDFSKDEYDEDD